MAAALDRFLALARRFRVVPVLVILVALADLGGIFGGWFYYADVGQFDLHHLACGPASGAYCQPWYWWPLVADSPNAVLVFFVALLAYRLAGWRHKLLDALAFTLNIYVGLWTTTLFLSYRSTMGTFAGGTNTVLFVTHMGMPLQSLALVLDMRKDTWSRAGVAAMLLFLAAFVAVDYWGPHLHPAPFIDGGHDDVVGWSGHSLLALESVVLMLVTAVLWFALCKPLTSRGRQGTA